MGFEGRTISPDINEQLGDFLGLDAIRRRLKVVEIKTGSDKKSSTPIITGSTAADKIDSLISALAVLGLIEDSTT